MNVVSFHGGLGKDKSRPNEPITAKVLVLSRATLNQQKLLLLFNKKCGCKADWQMIYYADAVHGFTNPEYGDDKSTEYNAVAAKFFEHQNFSK
jgi:dienelactone hydrolase